MTPQCAEVRMPDDIHQSAPDVFAAARTRRSIRAYKPDPVPGDTLREIVALGRHARSRQRKPVDGVAPPL
jgi:hypothetical protein